MPEALEALATVEDPEVGLDVVALGLIYGISTSEAGVFVAMTLTTPACPMGHYLCRTAEHALRQRGFRSAEVRLVWTPLWSPAMIDDEARKARFDRSTRLAP